MLDSLRYVGHTTRLCLRSGRVTHDAGYDREHLTISAENGDLTYLGPLRTWICDKTVMSFTGRCSSLVPSQVSDVGSAPSLTAPDRVRQHEHPKRPKFYCGPERPPGVHEL